jgi:predicted dehydrogenase
MRVIKTALLSFGLSGKVFHAPFIATHPGFQLLGAWERSKRVITSEYPETKSYGSLEEVLGDEEVDLVVVNSPTSTHADFASKALKAGKHVIVEKAFTSNTEEALALSRMAAKTGLKLSVFHNRRWDSDFKTVRKVMDDGLLGDIVEAQIAYERFNPILSPKAHRETPGPGAGNLMDLGPHCVDQALTLFGMPEAIFADVRACRPGSQVDDYFDILLYYGKLRVRLKSSYLVREIGPGFILHGTKGTFLKRRSDVQETQLKQGMKPDAADFGIEPPSLYGLLHTEVDGSVKRETIQSLPGNYGGYYDAMHAALQKNAPVPVTPEEATSVMRILDTALESHRRKAVVQL